MGPPLSGPLSRRDAGLDERHAARSWAGAEGALRALTAAASAAMVGCVVVIFVALALATLDGRTVGSTILSTTWSPALGSYGLLPLTFGTLVASLLGVLVAAPVGVLAAIWIVELAPPWVSGPARALVDVIATLPGVMFGLWGRTVVVPFVRDHLAPANDAGPSAGFGLVTAGIVLGAMILPTITALACGALGGVPASLREAAVALGGQRWDVIRHAVLPVARAGLWGAVAIGLARALAESLAVEMVCGSNPLWPRSLFAPFSTLGAVLVDETVDATRVDHIAALAGAAVWLCVLVVPVMLVGRRLLRPREPAESARVERAA